MRRAVGYQHPRTTPRGGIIRKDKPTKCNCCETESYWRERIAREIEAKEDAIPMDMLLREYFGNIARKTK